MRHLLTNEKQRNLLKCVSSPLSALSSLTMNVLVKRGTDLYERRGFMLVSDWDDPHDMAGTVTAHGVPKETGTINNGIQSPEIKRYLDAFSPYRV